MLSNTSYFTISGAVEALYIERSSRFLSFAFPVKNGIEIKTKLNELKLAYPDATHHCYAWILHVDKSSQRLNDDGEPANSAARPILKYINALNLTNILVVVVRYFGGKKLGIPGLIFSYGMATKLCLDKAEIVNRAVKNYFEIKTNLENSYIAFNLIHKFSATIIENLPKETLSIILSIDIKNTETFETECKNLANFEYVFLKME